VPDDATTKYIKAGVEDIAMVVAQMTGIVSEGGSVRWLQVYQSDPDRLAELSTPVPLVDSPVIHRLSDPPACSP